MFPDPITLVPFRYNTDTSVPATVPGHKIGWSQNGATYRLTEAAGLPETMVINHQVVGKGVTRRDRHYLRLETPSEETEVGTTHGHAPAVLYMVADIPVNYINDATTRNLAKYMAGCLLAPTGAVLVADLEWSLEDVYVRWLNGES